MVSGAVSPDVYEQLGRRIRAHRLAAGLTLETLGEISALGPGYIGQIERGRKKASLKTVAALAAALDISMSELFEEPDARRGASIDRQIQHVLRTVTAKKQAFLLSALRHLVKQLKSLR